MSAQDYIVASGASSGGRGPEIRGFQNIQTPHRNRVLAQLLQHTPRCYEGELAVDGALGVGARQFTGRSPKAGYVVREALTRRCVRRGSDNRTISETPLFPRVQSVVTRQGSLRAGLLRGRRCRIRHVRSCNRRVGLKPGHCHRSGRAVRVIFYALSA
jgi:hypothetical protein